ncbi:Glycosyltransferase, GT2 family [Bradyrhizobium sp. Rc2d]|uniref:glycosyltransferase n=1 Tax=Bradyrhizobium sp. Rc2d TaxID=1855321 RepID=UPI00088F991A|nr:glycosyltransferase [Bradyrhizobium sp. Rc2d]SDG37999.1 Glycosyltransferase, GT2 family [Bradyrhizobium sp. Rc2d]
MIQPPSDLGPAIIIVTYNSAPVLSGLLDSLPAGLEGVKQFQTIVVDNDSQDSSVHIALTHPTRPRVIRMGRNAGYAAAINAAAATVSPITDLLILNPDVRLFPGGVRLLLDRLADSSVGIAVPRIFEANGEISWTIRREPSVGAAWAEAVLGGTLAARLGAGDMVCDPAVYDRDGLIDWATGAILAVSGRMRAIVGEWDESFFLYMEEVDYMRRVRECGLSVAYVPDARAMHIGGEYRENPRLRALLTANRIRYHRRHHGPISTAALRLGIILGEGMRALRGPPAHRAAVRAALRPWEWPAAYQPGNQSRPADLAPS